MLTFATKKLSESTGHGAKGQKEDAAPFRLAVISLAVSQVYRAADSELS